MLPLLPAAAAGAGALFLLKRLGGRVIRRRRHVQDPRTAVTLRMKRVNPLRRGHSRATISHNIRELMRSGRSQKQAIAIAFRAAGLSRNPMKASYDKNSVGYKAMVDDGYGRQVISFERHPTKKLALADALRQLKAEPEGMRALRFNPMGRHGNKRVYQYKGVKYTVEYSPQPSGWNYRYGREGAAFFTCPSAVRAHRLARIGIDEGTRSPGAGEDTRGMEGYVSGGYNGPIDRGPHRRNPKHDGTRTPASIGTAAARVAQWRWHHNPYGDRRDFRKIDIYVGQNYRASTTWAKDLKEAKQKFLENHPNIHASTVSVQWAERRNPETEAHELALYAVNDGTLYRQRAQPIMANLRKKIRKGAYDATKALKLWCYLADAAAQQYTKEMGTPGPNGSYGAFSKADRALAAKEIAAHYAEELQENNPERRARIRHRCMRNPGGSRVIPSQVWKHKTTGRTASVYGAHPAVRAADHGDWERVTQGWTVAHPDGTVGIGRRPWATKEEAQAWVDAHPTFRGMAQNPKRRRCRIA